MLEYLTTNLKTVKISKIKELSYKELPLKTVLINIKDKTMNLQETFGIPKLNANLSLDDIINSVISKFQPTKPEKSSVTLKEFSSIDENNKPSLYMFEPGNILFSNMIFVNREDLENLDNAVFATKIIENRFDSGYIRLEFVNIVGDNGYLYFIAFNAHNTDCVTDVISEFRVEKDQSILNLFIKANLKVKGLKAVEMNGIRLTTEDVLKRIMR